MSDEYIIRREKCDYCKGQGYVTGSTEGGTYYGNIDCPQPKCNGGYTETRIPADDWLLEKLAALRWDETTDLQSFDSHGNPTSSVLTATVRGKKMANARFGND